MRGNELWAQAFETAVEVRRRSSKLLPISPSIYNNDLLSTVPPDHHTRIRPSDRPTNRVDYGWIQNPIHWIIQYWIGLDWIKGGLGLDWIRGLIQSSNPVDYRLIYNRVFGSSSLLYDSLVSILLFVTAPKGPRTDIIQSYKGVEHASRGYGRGPNHGRLNYNTSGWLYHFLAPHTRSIGVHGWSPVDWIGCQDQLDWIGFGGQSNPIHR